MKYNIMKDIFKFINTAGINNLNKENADKFLETLPFFPNLLIIANDGNIIQVPIKYIFNDIRMTKKRLRKFEENFTVNYQNLVGQEFECYDGNINGSFLEKTRKLLLQDIKS